MVQKVHSLCYKIYDIKITISFLFLITLEGKLSVCNWESVVFFLNERHKVLEFEWQSKRNRPCWSS